MITPRDDQETRTITPLRILRFLFLWIFLYVAWIIFTQEFNPPALFLGLALSLVGSIFSYPVFFNQEQIRQSRFIYRWDLILVYFIFLIVQSYLASFALIFRMLTGKYKPGVIRIRTKLRSQIGRTMLANTISLVPGTLSLWVDGRFIYVHWFDQKSKHRIEAGRIIKQPMEDVLEKIFG